MKNNITLPPGVDSLSFFQQITEHLSNNLDKKLCNSVSTLLAIDYANRLNSKPPLKEYINICIKRLKKYLGPQVVLDNNFSASMTLFTAAITPEKDDNEKAKKQLQDALIESTIASLFGDIIPEEQATIRLILRDLLTSEDGKELMNIISSEPKKFYSIVTSAIKTKKQQQEILESVEMYLVNVMNQSKKLDQKVNGIKNTLGKIVLAGSVLIATSIGLVIGGFALPILLVPATISAIKYGPIIGEKLGNSIAKNSTVIQQETNLLKRINTASISAAKTKNKAVKPLSKNQIKSLANSVDTKSIEIFESRDKGIDSKTKTVLEQKAKSTDKGKRI